MFPIFEVLALPEHRLITHPEIARLCIFARRARLTCAAGCILAFFAMIAVVTGHSHLAWEQVPALAGASLLMFISFGLLASRFGRLCSAQVTSEDKVHIGHLRRSSPACEEYYAMVYRQKRPFTRLDLRRLTEIARQ